MKILVKTTLALLLLGGCAEESKPASQASRDAGSAESTAPDASEQRPIPLLTWVDDLIDKRSSDDALPDTVDDKNIEDTEDQTAFDKYLQ